MIDLETYRSRIGCFRCGHSSYSGYRAHPGFSMRNSGVLAFCISFIVITGLASGSFVDDPSIELNPGPGFASVQERSAFFKLKAVYIDISRVSCHQVFLRSCDTLGLVPRGFWTEKLSLTTCKPNESVIAALHAINSTSAKEKVRLHLSHYEEIISHLIQKKEEISKSLAEICTTTDRFNDLLHELESNMIRDRDKRMENHNKKLNILLDTQLTAEEWLPDLRLTSIERTFIVDNEYLCDRVIDAAMMLLQESYPDISLQSVLLSHSLLAKSNDKTIHIHHVSGNHFITSSNLQSPGSVTIYDSLKGGTSDPNLHLQLTAIYSPDSCPPTIRQAQITNGQQGGVDCGVFAIAYAVELAFGNNPADFVFDQRNMRKHLLSSLENRCITPFPKKHHIIEHVEYHHVNKSTPSTKRWSPSNKTFRPSTAYKETSPPIPTQN